GLLLLTAPLQQLGLEDVHGGGPVLDLGPLVLAGDDDAGGDVRDAHRGVGGVHALPAGAGRTVDVDAQIGLVDVDVVGLLDDRQHLDPGEGGLAAALVVEGRDAHQAVRALLDGEGAVGVGRLHGEGGRLDAGLFGVRRLVDLRLVAVLLGPAQIHPLELLGEVGGVDAAGLGADVDQGLTGVVLAGQEGADLHLVQRLADRLELRLGLRPGVRVVLLLGHLEQHGEIVDPAAQRLGLPDLRLEVGELAGDLLRLVRVVPQGRRGRLLLEHGDICPDPVEVQDGLDRLHGRGEGLELFGYIDDCHALQRNGSAARPTPGAALLGTGRAGRNPVRGGSAGRGGPGWRGGPGARADGAGARARRAGPSRGWSAHPAAEPGPTGGTRSGLPGGRTGPGSCGTPSWAGPRALPGAGGGAGRGPGLTGRGPGRAGRARAEAGRRTRRRNRARRAEPAPACPAGGQGPGRAEPGPGRARGPGRVRLAGPGAGRARAEAGR